MADFTIGDLPEATSVGDDDPLELQTTAGNSRKVKRRTLLGGAGLGGIGGSFDSEYAALGSFTNWTAAKARGSTAPLDRIYRG
ncbi:MULTISPECIES: hypothetical protein [unclassified Sphingobium]|uniref:hypothetical protein n=1 Tax=unclassified Sphingobium TaxID=2611147 RepID=UPI000A8A6AA0|nr:MULTISPECIES: hypothetical protein [unclassified Sphingobium]